MPSVHSAPLRSRATVRVLQVPLRPPGTLKPIPIDCTLRRLFKDEAPSKFKPSADEVRLAFAQWPALAKVERVLDPHLSPSPSPNPSPNPNP